MTRDHRCAIKIVNNNVGESETGMDGAERQASAARARQVAQALEEDIVLGWLQPRERLIEEDLATRFEVKRHVVREAIAELERMGLVERVQNKGAAVRMLSPTDV